VKKGVYVVCSKDERKGTGTKSLKGDTRRGEEVVRMREVMR
jgi:hypothetical protein